MWRLIVWRGSGQILFTQLSISQDVVIEIKPNKLSGAFFVAVCFSAVVATADERSLNDILRDGNNAFTAKIFTEIIKEKPAQSVVLSAFSVLTPLAQIALASVGESHDELLATIGMPSDNITKAVFSEINNHLKSVKGVTLKTASKIYVAQNYELNTNFSVLSRDVFGSDVANVDFIENEKSAKEINLWVEEHTNNRIKELVDPSALDGSTRALLVNAIYFKGLWEIPFDKSLTSSRNFYISKEKNIQVPTMYSKNYYRYIDSQELNAQLLELKYQGGEAALYIILPHEIDGISKLEEKLTDPSLLDNVIDSMYNTRVIVYLPKFKIETTTDLKQVLKNINVKKLFNEQEARLDNLLKGVNSGLFINDAKQKAFIEVNEEGAEAAATNVFSTMMRSSMSYIPSTPVFNADRPFYFVVKENNLSLFNGIYASN